MLRLIRPLYQWDTGRPLYLEEEDIRIDSVDFWQDNRDTVMTVAVDRDTMTVPVPNILLQQDRPFIAYEMANCNTIRPFRFRVLARKKPPGYVFTTQEILNWNSLDRRLCFLERGGIGGSITADDDGAGNVYMYVTGMIVADDSEGNVTIGG